MKERAVGIVGLGLMGYEMAAHLREKGIEVIGADIDPKAREMAEAIGCIVSEDSAAVAQSCVHIIVSMSVLEAYYQVMETISQNARPGTIVLETSTLTVEDKNKGLEMMKKAGGTMIDASISGNSTMVKQGTAIGLLSGDSQAIKDTAYMIETFCRQWFDLGTFGNSTKMKIVNNHQTCINAAGVAECLFLAEKLGLDLHQTVDVLKTGSGGSVAMNVHGPIIADRRWDIPTNRVMKYLKDQHITCELLGELGCPAPMYKAAVILHKRTAERGHENDDRASIFQVLEEMDREKFQLPGLDCHVDKDTI